MMNHVFLWINSHPIANSLDILVYRQILPKLYAHPLDLKHVYLFKGNFALDLNTIAGTTKTSRSSSDLRRRTGLI